MQHNVFVILKEKMEELAHSAYTTSVGKENERTHHSFIRFNNEKSKILSVLNSIEYKDGIATSPKELIKFYQVNQNNTNALLNNYLWAANPSSFNDPFDCPSQLWKIESFTRENLLRILEPKAHSLISDSQNDNLSLFQITRIAALGIICLHDFKDTSQDILWGYYTNQKGFSIKFDTQQLLKQWGEPFNVEYIEPKELNAFSLNEIEETGDLFPRFLRWTTQKKIGWKVENEWRFIFSNLRAETQMMDAPPEERMKNYPSRAIKEVVLGLGFFDDSNSVHLGNDYFYFIADSVKHQAHNQILTYLSNNSKIPISHMFFIKEKLEMHPRRCEIYKVNDNRFLIKYIG